MIMKQEDKELLLKDLCARLPYKCKYKASKKITHWHKLTLNTRTIGKIIDDYYDEIKPYLRPMSSMTEEERKEVNNLIKDNRPIPYGKINNKGMDNLFSSVAVTSSILIDWLNAHHFDYRGLIEKGLAIEI